VYELSAASIQAIRFISGMAQPRASATESRLALVIQALAKLAEDTDADKGRRIEQLERERERITLDIAAINEGRMHVLSDQKAAERLHELINLVDDLFGDFSRVREEFEKLNQDLRKDIIENEDYRSKVLESLFNNIDLIRDSDAGKTFEGFWNLLNNPIQSGVFNNALDNIMERQFAKGLDMSERRFLTGMTRTLLSQGGAVHSVLQSFARSLRHFVESQEYLEQQRISNLLKDTRRAALALRDSVQANRQIKYSLPLTSAKINSISRWTLFDPAKQVSAQPMAEGENGAIGLEQIAGLISQSEIDFRTLKANINSVLRQDGQATIASVLEKFPATQGLGSVAGLLALGTTNGILMENESETVEWEGMDGAPYSASIQKIYFTRQFGGEGNT
jgi:hypothetical protein